MPVRIRGTETSLERRIAVAMITDTNFLTGLEPMWQGARIRAAWIETLAEWCFDYWRLYGKAPGLDIQPIYERWAQKRDESQTEILARILDSLSREHEQERVRHNTQYMLDQTHEWITREGLTLLADDIRACLDSADAMGTNDARALVDTWKVPQRMGSIGGNPLTDKEGWRTAYEDAEDPLFEFPGSLGEMIGPVGRGEFAAFMGPEKRGKTWWLLFTAMRALENRCRVAYFQLGDLTQQQVYRRLGTYLTGRSHLTRHCKARWIPVLDCAHNQNGSCAHAKNSTPLQTVVDEESKKETVVLPPMGNLSWRPCTRCMRLNSDRWTGASWLQERKAVEPLIWSDAWDQAQQYMKRVRDRLRMHFSANGQTGVRDMERILDRWEKEEGFIPDVVVADYADLWKPENPNTDFRHQQNDAWSRARGLSMERHVALITATQADARSYDAQRIKAKNFSEDKRKYGHVSLGMWTLNQTPEEKQRRIIRIGRMFVREDDFHERDCCYIIQDLSAGRPFIGGWRG